MFGLGMPELLVILVIALLIFGAGRLPEVGSGLGKAIREFKHGVHEAERGEGEEETTGGDSTSAATEAQSLAEGETSSEEKGIEQLPGVQEVKDLQAKVSTVKKWSRLLFR
ncbi:MAG: twin-arginine translocase TatA/TatE family subunit [Nitrospinota bacterium]|nr:MAG: twin-arginine translocase TatA/TatE family subunit [Nitrospinota bacterium]